VGKRAEKLMKKLFSLFLFLLVPATQLRGDTSNGAEVAAAKDIADILDQRDRLVTEVAQLTSEVQKLRNDADQLSKTEDEIVKLKSEVSDLQKNLSGPGNATRIDNDNINLKALTQDLGGQSSKQLRDQADSKEKTIKEKQAQIGGLLSSLTGKLSGEQTFKQSISFYYAALIAIVILGFFSIAFRDEDVRKAIFSGEAGIQFVTLFSLVIAIILFGISGILDGRELGALLGGLSGYILGRTRQGQGTPPPGGGGGGT
jgi:hypothetical protein